MAFVCVSFCFVALFLNGGEKHLKNMGDISKLGRTLLKKPNCWKKSGGGMVCASMESITGEVKLFKPQ